MQRGDHLISVRYGYAHHGIYIGAGDVIHYSGFGDSVSGPICRVSLEKFSSNMPTTIVPHPLAIHGMEARIARANSRLGEDSYNLITNNCEHFVSWCIYGTKTSSQVRAAMSLVEGVAGMVPGVGPVVRAARAALTAKTIVDACFEASLPIAAAAKTVSKVSIGSASAVVVAATVAGGPVGLVGALGVLAAKKIFLSK